ncbi:MAG: TetR/AcrR family transcriptional regulator [Steroidobacteraceae bacterium]
MATTASDKPVQKLGRKRSDQVHANILQATLRQLSEGFYQSLRLEHVAEEAGVGKATIYRWWKSKGALVVEALVSALKPGRAAITGSPVEDLKNTIDATVRNYSNNLTGVTVPALAADLVKDPELREAFLTDFLGPRRAVARMSLEQAMAAGLLPKNLDTELMMDMWAGAVFYRTLFGTRPLNKNFTQQILDLLLERKLPTKGR